MKKWFLAALLALSLAAAAGQVFSGQARTNPANAGYVCPVTGEQLPCLNCCPW